MSWPVVKVGEVCNLMTGGTPRTNVAEFYENGSVPWIVSGDIHKQEIFDCEKRITEHAVENSNARYLPKDSVLIALNGQGKTRGTVALLRIDGATCNQSIVSINPKDKGELFSDYLFYYLKSQYQNIRNITGDKDRAGLNMPLIRQIEIPLPPLTEQTRIAAILDKADAIRRKRQEAIQLADEFLRSVFLDMFGDPVTNPKGWKEQPLHVLADIRSGVTKGKKVDLNHSETLPYMRVANVQDGYIDLSDIKQIVVSKSDAKKYVLKRGDLLLTEGGDPDKLGRGYVWNGEIENCLHQNHIFSVRIKISKENLIRPQFLSATVGSLRGKRYFLKVGKQTTGIATINKTVLSEFPALVPPIKLQDEYIEICNKVASLKNTYAHEDLDLMQSCQQSLFSNGR